VCDFVAIQFSVLILLPNSSLICTIKLLKEQGVKKCNIFILTLDIYKDNNGVSEKIVDA